MVVPFPDASQPSNTTIVGTPLSQHAFSRSYRRVCRRGRTCLNSSRESFFLRLIFSNMAERRFYTGGSRLAFHLCHGRPGSTRIRFSETFSTAPDSKLKGDELTRFAIKFEPNLTACRVSNAAFCGIMDVCDHCRFAGC